VTGVAGAHAVEDRVSTPPGEKRLIQLTNIIAPRLEQARRRLWEIGPEGEFFYTPLLTRLLSMLDQTLVVELHMMRLRNELDGASPSERFDHFTSKLLEPSSQSAFEERYPALIRRVHRAIEDGIEFADDFASALRRDHELLRETFAAGRDLGALDRLTVTGDPHRGGRAVLVLRFASGTRVVYKPRGLVLEAAFQRLLGWLEGCWVGPFFRRLAVVDRGTHGWMEFAAGEPCLDVGQVRRFHRRQGALVALTHALGATDLHHENLIACGEHPVLFDLETVLQPRLPRNRVEAVYGAATELLQRSILETGLVPTPDRDGYDVAGPDLSGIGARAGAVTQSVPVWDHPGTDRMRLAQRPVQSVEGSHLPTLRDSQVNPLDYLEDIAGGFTAMFRCLSTHGERLVDDTGPLQPFFDARVRVILRDTGRYARFLRGSYHPKLLRDEGALAEWFDKLELALRHNPELKPVTAYERRDLDRGDVPLFQTEAEGRDLITGSGETIPAYFQTSGREVVVERIRGFDEDSLRRQRWILEASIAALGLSEGLQVVDSHRLPEAKGPFGPAEALDEAVRIGSRLRDLAIRRDGTATWLGVEPAGATDFAVQPLGSDLYDGLPGIILFLAHLARASGDSTFEHLAREALTTLEAQIDEERGFYEDIGAFCGWAGLVYAYTQLGLLWHEGRLLERADGCTDDIRRHIDHDDALDILGGSAGSIAVLLSTGGDVETARLAGDRLVSTAVRLPGAVAWKQGGSWPQPLAGFSHGAAGFAWALIRLADATGQERYRTTALEAIEYERQLFDRDERNWPDLRWEHRNFAALWCHGAPGIGLSRLDLLGQLDGPEIRREIDDAVHTTLSVGFGSNHCLCHGDLGNLELIRRAAEVLEDEVLARKVDELSARIVADVRSKWRTGLPRYIESPGLMTGLAGIGYGLLRIAEPENVPCLLLLESIRE
jgi:type 2 lantibiotic biosynthesis protein LanM